MPKNDTIFQRLEQATEVEILEICNILELDSKYVNDVDKISKEFRSVSGHSIANTFRDAHALEYKDILSDIYCGIKSHLDCKDFTVKEASEIALEDRVNLILKTMIEKYKDKNLETADKELKNQLISDGNRTTKMEGILGGGGIGLFARLISLPVAIVATTGQYISNPTYKKTFQVVAILIQIKNRLEAEQKLKDN